MNTQSAVDGGHGVLRPLLLSALLLAAGPALAEVSTAPASPAPAETEAEPRDASSEEKRRDVTATAETEQGEGSDSGEGDATAAAASDETSQTAETSEADELQVAQAPAAGASAQEPSAAGQAGQAAQAAAQPASDAAAGPRARNRLDPWENWNRKVFGFNEKLDENVLRPVATAYSDLVPSPARQAVDNFFGNFTDAWSAVNLFLQGRFKIGAQQTMRVAVNSVIGLAGLIDIATPAGLEKTTEDLGRTLGYWGIKTGPYIVWPVLGPSSLRDSVTLPVNTIYSPAYMFNDGEYKVAITLLQVVNTRANLLRVTDMLDGIALDKYTFVRDAYLQRRNVKTHREQEQEEDDYEVITP